MTAIQAFQDTLLSAHQEAKSGRLFIYTSTLTSRPAEMDICNGEVAAIRYANQTGKPALDELLTREVTQVLFVPATESNVETSVPTPTVNEILRAIDHNDNHQFTQELVTAVEKIFAETFGSSVTSKIEALAAAYTPDQNPIQFLDRCQQEVAGTFGFALANKQFRPLFEKAHSATQLMGG